MFPPIDQMISDILVWLERPDKLEIWFDPDSEQYCVCVWDEIHRNSDLEKCLSGAWAYIDKHRSRPTTNAQESARPPRSTRQHAPDPFWND